MSDDKDKELNKDGRLDKLIWMAYEDDSEFIRPDPETITAYLLDKATDEQKKEIRSALLKSSAFRYELHSMIQDIQLIEQSETVKAKEEISVEKQGFWNGIKEKLSWYYYVPAATAAVCVLFVIFLSQAPPKSSWEYVLNYDESGYWQRNVTRQRGEEFDNPQDAAFASIQALVEFKNSQISFISDYSKDEIQLPVRNILLKLTNDINDNVIEINGRISLTHEIFDTSLMAWAFSLEHSSLYSFYMDSDTLTALWNTIMGYNGCIVFTYQDSIGYHATNGHIFQIQ